jgi:hypothetical protein
MNYIKKLQAENDSLNSTLTDLKNLENDLRRYLTSDKFAGFENKFVNPDDILRRLDEFRQAIQTSEMKEIIEA